MKNKFSKHWKKSNQPRKQRKYLANAPLHLKRKILNINLSKELRKKYGRRNISGRKGDVVKIMRGRFKKKKGKIVSVKTKISKIEVDGIQIKKQDGSKVNIKFRPSNVQIVELYLEDRKRNKSLENIMKEEKPESKEIGTESKGKEKNNAREDTLRMEKK